MNLYRSIYAVCTLSVILAITTWVATGREGYTRWPNSKLQQADAPSNEAEDDLLTDIGFATVEDTETLPEIKSQFALGLVPGGFDPMHLLSVASVTTSALGVSGIAAFAAWKSHHSPREE